MKVSREGVTQEEVKRLQVHARTFDTLRFEHCYKTSGLDTYSVVYSIAVDQQNAINEIENGNV